VEYLSLLSKERPTHRQDFNTSEPMERWIDQNRVKDLPSIFHVFEAAEHKPYTGILDAERDILKRIRLR
jgi:hypothetical protein